ncbi:MAG: hypothetical protein U7123_01595 [Potamolinea sp.]
MKNYKPQSLIVPQGQGRTEKAPLGQGVWGERSQASISVGARAIKRC